MATAAISASATINSFKKILGEWAFSMDLEVEHSRLIIQMASGSRLVVNRKIISTEEIQQISGGFAQCPQQLFEAICSSQSIDSPGTSGNMEFVESRGVLIIKLNNLSRELCWTIPLERLESTAEMKSEFMRQFEKIQEKQNKQHQELLEQMKQLQVNQLALFKKHEELFNMVEPIARHFEPELKKQQEEKRSTSEVHSGFDEVDGGLKGGVKNKDSLFRDPQFVDIDVKKERYKAYKLSENRTKLTRSEYAPCSWQGFLSEQVFSSFTNHQYTLEILNPGKLVENRYRQNHNHEPIPPKSEQCMMIGVARRHTSTENGVNPREGTWMLHIYEGNIRYYYVNGHHKVIKKPKELNKISQVTVRLDNKKMRVYFSLDDMYVCDARLGKDDDPRELVAAVDLYCPGQEVRFMKADELANVH